MHSYPKKIETNQRKPIKRRKTPIFGTNDSMHFTHLKCTEFFVDLYLWGNSFASHVSDTCEVSASVWFFELKCDVFEILFAVHRTCYRLSANNFKYLDSECSFYGHTLRSTCFCLSDYLICNSKSQWYTFCSVHQLCLFNYAFDSIMLSLKASWISVTVWNPYGQSSIWGEMSLLSHVTTNSNQVYFILDFCCESHFLNW